MFECVMDLYLYCSYYYLGYYYDVDSCFWLGFHISFIYIILVFLQSYSNPIIFCSSVFTLDLGQVIIEVRRYIGYRYDINIAHRTLQDMHAFIGQWEQVR